MLSLMGFLALVLEKRRKKKKKRKNAIDGYPRGACAGASATDDQCGCGL